MGRRLTGRPWFLVACTLSTLVGLCSQPCWSSQIGKRDLLRLSTGQIASLVSSPDPVKNIDPSNPSSHLSKILIPRAPDTENNTFVKTYIASTLKALNWHVEEDSFTDTTPVGVKSFTNVIATFHPDAPRRVVLSAHFDSKYYPTYPDDQFVGATDSAAPCAMLLDLAEAFTPLLKARKERLESGVEEDEDVSETTLQLIFFDGEEAFVKWSETDSLYGSRHLAQKWEKSFLPPHPKRRLLAPSGHTQISTIEHLILLDLLGAANPSIRSAFIDTAWLFDGLVSAELRLRDGGFLNVDEKDAKDYHSFFVPRSQALTFYSPHVEDDHLPFLHRGVSIVHIIATPFPQVWHSLKDDASALDVATMRRWNLILRLFMSEYLRLQPDPLPSKNKPRDELGAPNSDRSYDGHADCAQ